MSTVANSPAIVVTLIHSGLCAPAVHVVQPHLTFPWIYFSSRKSIHGTIGARKKSTVTPPRRIEKRDKQNISPCYGRASMMTLWYGEWKYYKIWITLFFSYRSQAKNKTIWASFFVLDGFGNLCLFLSDQALVLLILKFLMFLLNFEGLDQLISFDKRMCVQINQTIR